MPRPDPAGPERSLASIRVDFHSPLFLGVDYAVRLISDGEWRESTLRVVEGQVAVVVDESARLRHASRTVD